MQRRLTLAAVQLDAAVAPISERLERARHWVGRAARSGADLIVLPELFSSGYSYEWDRLAPEPWDGPSRRLLVDLARAERRFVTGSFLVRERGDVFNALLLAGPDGSEHRYDKIHPWGWERSLFRGSAGRGVVAETPFGRIGLMVCWDTAHPKLWAEYAGRVDLVVASSCPPDVSNPTFRLEDGKEVTLRDSPLLRGLSGGAGVLFGEMLDEQAAWLDVPLVNSVGCGRVRTRVPRSGALAWAFAPFDRELAGRWRDFERAELCCELTPGCKVVARDGSHAAERGQAEGEGFALAEVELGAGAMPQSPQPRSRLPRSAYLLSDHVLPRLMEPVYRENLGTLAD